MTVTKTAIPLLALLISLSLSSCSILQDIKNLGTTSDDTASSIETIPYPKKFPAPQYPGSKPIACADTSVGNVRIRSVTMITKDEARMVCKVYAKWFEKHGWAIKNPAADMGMGWSISAEKGADRINISALHQKTAKETTLTLNVSTRNESDPKEATR